MKHAFLTQHRPLPEKGQAHNIVQWHVFRSLMEADEYANHVKLGAGQHCVGGCDQDSVGRLWWVGVEVDDLASWGNRSAINKHRE